MTNFLVGKNHDVGYLIFTQVSSKANGQNYVKNSFYYEGEVSFWKID